MTIPFKPGQHPDADQLSALIEQALPAHERDGVLAHLAVCPECRGVVALTLPDEPVAVDAAEPRRLSTGKSWLAGWMVFLPAAAAVAALAAFIFFVPRQGSAPHQQAQLAPAPAATVPPQVQTAPQEQKKVISAEPRGEIATAAPPPANSNEKRTTNVAMGSARAGSVGASQPNASRAAAPQVAVENQPVQSAPAQSEFSSFAPAATNSVASQNQSPQQANAPRNVFHGGAIGGTLQSNNTLQQADANAQNRQRQNGLQQAPSQTVQVQAEAPAPVATESAELDTMMAGANRVYAEQPLPSRLAVLSSAARGTIVLAIDTHHAVFMSSDSGQHWTTVRTVWKGRAVKVEAVAPAEALAMPASGASTGFYAGMPQGAVAAKMSGTTLTGTVTDQSGAIVAGATVTATDPRTHVSRSVSTDANGRYIAAGLEPGSYDLDATAQGFTISRLSNVAVTASKPSVANFTLRVGAAAESVTVDASVELKAAPGAASKQGPAPLFEMVTDMGVHWTSADGLSWQRK